MPRELLEAWMRGLGWQSEVAQGYGLAPFRQFANWSVLRYGVDHLIVDGFIAYFLAEVSQYLHRRDPLPRQAVRSAIGSAIATHQPQIIIAHSLGSIATYETWSIPASRSACGSQSVRPWRCRDRFFPSCSRHL